MVNNLLPKIEIPKKVPNWINGKEIDCVSGEFIEKINPHNGEIITLFSRSSSKDSDLAVSYALKSFKNWANLPAVRRGDILFQIAQKMKENQNEIAAIVALETGKSLKDAIGETSGAIQLAFFMAGEGQRLYGKTTTSSSPNKYPMIIREPVGIAALIIAFNTPIANITWKVFPALISGNTTILKPSEDIPLTAWYFTKLAYEAGLPYGTLNVINGYGKEVGDALVRNPDVNLISFTGSTEVGRQIYQIGASRLAKVFLELGGKNPLVVCDDADLENAAKWVLLSAFSNAGQRCAACSRVILFESIYEKFKELLFKKTQKLKLGNTDDDDLGPVINEKQFKNILGLVSVAERKGTRILVGGKKAENDFLINGFYIEPTILENSSPEDDISKTELFGPVTNLYKVKSFDDALELANNSPYGLTASIHTKDINRATEFTRKVQAGVAIINGGTYGSEPNMPFGGVKNSGNGWREPGTEAIDVYTNYKNIITLTNPNAV